MAAIKKTFVYIWTPMLMKPLTSVKSFLKDAERRKRALLVGNSAYLNVKKKFVYLYECGK